MRGTTLSDPVQRNQQPDLRSSLHEISEYLDQQRAYDLLDHLVKELLTKQPEDPLQHMIDCLALEHGPLRVIATSPPGLGASALLRRLGERLGLLYLSAAELEREGGAELVVDALREADARMRGWVLDGFPRTRLQQSLLNEASVVPSHVVQLHASRDRILAAASAGRTLLEDSEAPCDVLEQLDLHDCHCSAALEPYSQLRVQIDCDGDPWPALERAVRLRPRSLGPRVPARIALLGPRGIGLRAHASRLAARLDAVLVLDGDRDRDRGDRGWVLCQPDRLEPRPQHVVVLDASVQTCIQRLRLRHTDAITRRVWCTRPRNERVRRRLQRNPRDQPPAVQAEYAAYQLKLEELLRGCDVRVSRLPADGPPELVHAELVELVERPPPLPG